MGILGFLLDNIWIVVIVLFVASRIFAKGAGKQGQGPRMPSFGGGDEPGGPAQPMRPAANRPERREAPETMYSGGHRPETAAGPKLDERRGGDRPQSSTAIPSNDRRHTSETAQRSERERLRRVHEPDAAYRSAMKPSEARGSRTTVAAANAAAADLSKEELRKGVLWAEVLGPPRAKRPFRR